MTCKEYRDKVIALFKSGEATEEQWEEMAEIVLAASEKGVAEEIDATIFPDGYPEE